VCLHGLDKHPRRFPGMPDPDAELGDESAICALVSQALQRPVERVLARELAPIEYDAFLSGRTLARLAGTALVAGESAPWSIILKRTSPVSVPPGSVAEELRFGAKREALAYESGLLEDLGGGLCAPRLLGAEHDDTGRITLWLEDVRDDLGPAWPMDRFRTAGRHLGQFNGAYLVSRTVPAFDWLERRWAERHSQPLIVGEALALIESLVTNSRVQRLYGDSIRDDAVRLLQDQPLFIETLRSLPQTLCHHDASRANLLARQARGGDETVAIDWEVVGPGPVGADIATLVFGTIRRGDVLAAHAHELEQLVLSGYVQGLRDAGWRGEERLVRFGYVAAVALRWHLLAGALRAVAQPRSRALRGRARDESPSRARENLIALSLFLLERANEARQIARVA
jgi:hypothetical protein